MPKKIKFALELANGKKVRTMEDLRENFNLEKIVGYFFNGRLVEWLEDRNYIEMALKVSSLDPNNSEFHASLCSALGVTYNGEKISTKRIQSIGEKKDKLKQLTSDEVVISKAEITAFTQEDLAYLLDKDEETIYLCGEKFYIPGEIGYKKYIGIIYTPVVFVSPEYIGQMEENRIIFDNVVLQEDSRSLYRVYESDELHEKMSFYQPSEMMGFILDTQDIEKTRKMYKEARKILGNVNFEFN